MFLLSLLLAAETTIHLEGDVPDDGLEHFFLPFEVPEGTAEVEIRHDDGSSKNILDWGLDDPAGFRGWGGGNSEPAIVGEWAASRSYLAGPMTPGTWNVVVGKAKIEEAPGQYTVDVVLRDTPTLAPQTERQPYAEAAPLSTGPRWYAGDLHVHSENSGDARPTLDAIATLARSRGLDFVEISDHNTTAQLDFFADAQARWPDLLFVPGVEFTTYHGHANGIGATAWVDHRIGQPGVTIADAVAAFEAQGAFFSLNHPTLDLGSLCIGCAWDQELDPAQVRGLEVITGGWDPVGQLFSPTAVELWESSLDQGYRVVPVGGSDDHTAGEDEGATGSPIGNPTTLIYAEELSVPALMAGLRAGRTVVKLQGPEDPMLELWPQTDREKAWIPDSVPFQATVTGGQGDTLQWIVNGQVVKEVMVDGDNFVTSYQPTASDDRIRAQLLVEGAPRVLTACWWLEHPIEKPHSCGCSNGTSLSLPGFLLSLLLVIRRRLAS